MKWAFSLSARLFPSLIKRDSIAARERPDEAVADVYADPTLAELLLSVTANNWMGSSGMFIEKVLKIEFASLDISPINTVSSITSM